MYIDDSTYTASQSSTENGVKTTIEVVQISNGYIHKMTTCKVDSNGNGIPLSGDNKNETKVYYSKNNLLEELKDKEDTTDDEPEDMTSIGSAMGKFLKNT